jgi:hypothetical protein
MRYKKRVFANFNPKTSLVARMTSPSIAKNQIARAFRSIAQPHPSESVLSLLRQHFDSSCAYCGAKIPPGPKQAHYDHLVSGGGNLLENFVLSCPDCNERKRDIDWKTFLKDRSTQHAFQKRHSLIEAWQKTARAHHPTVVDAALLEQAEACIARVLSVFDEELKKLRDFKRSRTT